MLFFSISQKTKMYKKNKIRVLRFIFFYLFFIINNVVVAVI